MSMRIITIVSFLLAVFIVGIVASFSPLLYTTQLTIVAKGKQAIRQSAVFIGGIVSGLFLLSLGIVIIQPETITFLARFDAMRYIHGWWIDGTIGLLCVIAGLYMIICKPRGARRAEKLLGKLPGPSPVSSPGPSRGQTVALYSFGLLRSITRVTGVAAILLGVRLIVQFNAPLLIHLIAFIVMMAGAAAPYVLLIVFREKATAFFGVVRKKVTKLRGYVPRQYTGGALIVLGCAFWVLMVAGR